MHGRIAAKMQTNERQDQDDRDDPKCLDPTWGAGRQFVVWLDVGGRLGHVLPNVRESDGARKWAPSPPEMTFVTTSYLALPACRSCAYAQCGMPRTMIWLA